MSAGLRRAVTVSALAGLAGLLAGCPFEFKKDGGDNALPRTFFDAAPGDTTFSNEAFFTWLGTDLDSDVVAYQYQLVETDSVYYYSAGQSGRVIRSIDPRREFTGSESDTLWSDRTLDNSQAFSELNDGWYEMRARSIDDAGFAGAPAILRFYVFFDDVPPTPIIIDPRPGGTAAACGRLPNTGITSWTFFVDATDDSRNAATPRTQLEYSYQLRARSSITCTTHLTDSFTEWRRFPSDGLPIEVGNAPPTVYSDLFDQFCGWEFTLRVRDPAGNVASTPCCITKTSGC